jgi:hypothetical protein
LAAAIVGLAVWRRKTLKEDAARAKEATTSAAGKVSAKVRGQDDDGSEGDADASAEEDSVAAGTGD